VVEGVVGTVVGNVVVVAGVVVELSKVDATALMYACGSICKFDFTAPRNTFVVLSSRGEAPYTWFMDFTAVRVY
jgi:hypothetical protein